MFHVKPRIVAVANQKGGVGKTTTVINLGAALAAYEHHSLLLDLDPQSNCTSGVGVKPGPDSLNTYHLVTGGEPAAAAIHPTAFPHLTIVPATPDLAGAEVELVGMVGREFRLRDALAALVGPEYVLIDCPPSLGSSTARHPSAC